MKIIKLTCALLLSAWVSSANATLIFDFSFTDILNGGGVISGEILGLSDNATGAASSLRILANSGGFGVGEYVGNPSLNSFTVVNGVLTNVSFVSYGSNNAAPDIVDSSFYWKTLEGIGLTNSDFFVSADPRSSASLAISLRKVNVPEPGTVILLSLGIAGLFASRYRKNS
ncbi:PEP-CTERM sorting domain-containing protein [Lacimicrobium sp. SS2-24]|uniref:PEP-CTERM sorting domain-containing protein n=1 Tax=Lacimicrobium sp. SS2-24 TaxID=2005569 RepID=UPI000B4AC867|nr:PEP-CTERM sorting domain-containing protein [Lacimicrobium sp. SS2-24]